MTQYFQCVLRQGDAETVAWIEERGAKEGASVELKSADGKFWRVEKVHKPGLEESALREKQSKDRNALPSILGKVKA